MHGFLLLGNVYAVRNVQWRIHTRCGKLCGSCGNPLRDGQKRRFPHDVETAEIDFLCGIYV